MKKVCIGFFGFIRNPISTDVFNNFKKLLPNNCTIDIIISSPNKINEYDSDIININSHIIENIRNTFNGCNVYIDIYEYDPFVFIKRVHELGLPDYTDCPSYRIFSQHFSISRLCKNISNISKDNNIDYDSIILTRADIIPGIKSLGELINNVTKNTVHIWRRSPYSSDSDAEDRIIISSIEGIHELCNLYELAVFKDPLIYKKLVPENILGKYLCLCDNLILLPQDGIDLNLSPSIHVKYSNIAKEYLDYLLNIYKDQNL